MLEQVHRHDHPLPHSDRGQGDLVARSDEPAAEDVARDDGECRRGGGKFPPGQARRL